MDELPAIHDVAIGVFANRYIVGVGVMELYRIILERGNQVIVEFLGLPSYIDGYVPSNCRSNQRFASCQLDSALT